MAEGQPWKREGGAFVRAFWVLQPSVPYPLSLVSLRCLGGGPFSSSEVISCISLPFRGFWFRYMENILTKKLYSP
jgi:hypothetical protein